MAHPFTDYDDLDSLGSRYRRRRMGPLKSLVEQVFERRGRVGIADLGGREAYWRLLPREFLEGHRVHVTLVNLPSDSTPTDDPLYTALVGDACGLPELPDEAFDIVHSNSLIEHVGDWERIKRFAAEARRLAPYLFVQTPYFWFPIEPHFVKPFHHWLPWPLRATISMRFEMNHQRKARDLDDAIGKVEREPFLLDQRTFAYLFPDCRILKERFLGVLVKSLIAYRGPQERAGATRSRAGR